MKLQLLIFAVAFSGCKASDIAAPIDDNETCQVPQSTILTDSTDTTDYLWECKAAIIQDAAKLIFFFEKSGTGGDIALDPDTNEVIFTESDRPWTRPTCIDLQITHDSGSTFTLSAINKVTDDSFNTNIRYLSSNEDFTYSYTCTKHGTPKN